jgi:hypothetical protein
MYPVTLGILCVHIMDGWLMDMYYRSACNVHVDEKF